MPDDRRAAEDIIRDLLVRELETVNVYLDMVARAKTPAVRALIADIAEQEKHHIAEAVDLLARFDAGQAEALVRAGVAIRRDEPSAASTVEAVYEPSGLSAAVEPGETLLAAALRHDVDIRHDCGGRGICGTCRVEVLDGAGTLSAVTDPERKHLSELLGEGWRLACQSTPSGAVRLRVPPNKKSEEEESDE